MNAPKPLLPPLTLYTSPKTRGTYVRWMLEECEAPYQVVSRPREQLRSAEHLRLNPLGKVPVLQAGEQLLTETLAIITWLAEQFPTKRLIPAAGSIERGLYYRWMCFATHLEYACIDQKRGLTAADAALRGSIGYGSLDGALDVLKARLQESPFIGGERFGALDLYYSGLLSWMIERLQMLPPEPVFLNYMSRHTARPAFAQAQALDAADAARHAQQKA